MPETNNMKDIKYSTKDNRANRGLLVVAVAILLAAAMAVLGFYIRGAVDADKFGKLKKELSEVKSELKDIQPKIDEYNAGIEEAETVARDNTAGNTSPPEKDVVPDTSKGQGTDSDIKGDTPDTVTAPFTVNGVIIVNKKHPLPKNYNPGENPEARAQADALVDAGAAAGVDLIHQYSSFRSYQTQAGLFNRYANQSGVAAAETYSARPGYSEHQTGLAFDLKNSAGTLYRINDNSYNYETDWVALHAHEYGFIVRYRHDWQSITGYMGEPWHLRYLGVDLATQVKNSGKTLEEFFGVEGGDYIR